MTDLEFVQRNTAWGDLLILLNEEAGEMIQASAKLWRVCAGRVPSPVTVDEAKRQLDEEVSDVLLVLEALGVVHFDAGDGSARDAKLRRWVQRIKDAKDKKAGGLAGGNE